MIQKAKQNSILAALVAAGMCISMQAQAESSKASDSEYDASSDDGGIERIEHASDFESLSQQIPAEACVFANSGHSAELAPLLGHAIEQFDHDLDALRNGGDPEHGMVEAEHNHRVLMHLDKLEELWGPFKAATENLAAGKNVDESLAYLAENNLALLDEAARLFTEVETEYANPVLVTESEALLLDFTSRERMYIEKISKESCGIVMGIPALGTVEDMHKSRATFEAILGALINGMPSAGVVKAPTEEILDALDDASEHWDEATVLLDKITGKDSIDHDTLEELFAILEKKRENFDEIELLYGHYAHAHH